MRVGRDVHDRLINRVQGGLRLVPGERVELMVRLNGKKPDADCLVITSARVMTLASTAEPLHWIRCQALADEVRTWGLSRKVRSRLTVTSGYGHTEVFGSSLNVYDDDLVEEHMAALVRDRANVAVVDAIKALRAEAHWMSSAYGRSVYVLDRAKISPGAAEVIDLDMVERQLSQFDYWPASEVRRHLAVCLRAGGCFLANVEHAGRTRSEPVPAEHAEAVSQALVTVDSARIKKSEAGEAVVFHQLMAVAAHIRATPSWVSSHLDENGLRVDLDDEVRQIALRCHQVAELRDELGDKPDARSETGRRTAVAHDMSLTALDSVVRRLEIRVRALASYRDRLRELSRELADLDSATRIAGVVEKVAGLTVAAGGEEEPGEDLAGLIPAPREATDAIPEAVAAVREEVERLARPVGQLIS